MARREGLRDGRPLSGLIFPVSTLLRRVWASLLWVSAEVKLIIPHWLSPQKSQTQEVHVVNATRTQLCGFHIFLKIPAGHVLNITETFPWQSRLTPPPPTPPRIHTENTLILTFDDIKKKRNSKKLHQHAWLMDLNRLAALPWRQQSKKTSRIM